MAQDLATRLKTKIEELVARAESLAQENARMRENIDRLTVENEKKQLKIEELQKQIEQFRLKEAFLGTSGDRTQARRRIAGLIKEIDACIGMLGE